MPIENEFKFVMKNDISVRECMKENGWTNFFLEQGYMSENARVRKISSSSNEKFVFTFKKMVGKNLVEIETDIIDADYEKLISCAENVLKKERFEKIDDHCTWAVDLFHGENGVYFIMAECERLDDREFADEIPNEIKEYILKEVGKDERFTSYRMRDEGYANKMLALVNESL